MRSAVLAAMNLLASVGSVPDSIFEGSPVDCVRWAPDGATLVSGSEVGGFRMVAVGRRASVQE